MPWICPECGRVFARNKQAHSCESYSLDPLFYRSGQRIRDLYETLAGKVMDFGAVDIRVGPYSVSIRNLSTFMNIMVEKDHLTISFVSARLIDEFPVYQNYQHSGKRWSNYVKIESPEEIDEQLLNWLRDAYNLTSS
jgi:hypothetical protein